MEVFMIPPRSRNSVVVASALVLFAFAAGKALGDTPWEELSDEDGIKVWRKDIEGSPIVAMRGRGTIDASVAKVASVIYDTPRCPEWVADLSTSRVVRLVSPCERVVYQRVATPWPLDDREFVFVAKASYAPATGGFLFKLASVDDGSVARTDGVTRGNLITSTFSLDPLPGEKTMLEVEVQADPMGSIPKSIVNWAQKAWPRETINAIRRQVEKPDVKVLDTVAAVMSESVAAVASEAR
jgi:hypothetical protein